MLNYLLGLASFTEEIFPRTSGTLLDSIVFREGME